MLERFLRTIVFCFVLAICLLKPEPALAQFASQKPEFIKVTDRVYCATGYSFGNAIYIITDKSIVVVDTTESTNAASQTLKELRKITQLPISYIIYTHFHPDHINGAKVFKGETTKIIAQKRLPKEIEKYDRIIGYKSIIKTIQYGLSLPKKERGVTLAISNDPNNPSISGYIPPDILFDRKYTFEEGGVEFELYHTIGETIDHLMVWLPQEKVLLPGDLFYESFPMLSSPMKPQRYIPEWADSVERMRQFKPAYLVPSHTKPIAGIAEIDTALANYAKAIRFVFAETIKAIDDGITLDQMRQQIHLPNELASLPYLQPIYGRVEWAINGIYKKYVGWYDLNPTHLHPLPSFLFHRALIDASGGTISLLKRSQQALQDDRLQIVLELTNIILDVEPSHAEAKAMRVQALERLAAQTNNTVELNIYLDSAQR